MFKIRKFISNLYASISCLIFGELRYKDDELEKDEMAYFKNELFYKLATFFIVLGLLPICYGAFLFFTENNKIAGFLEIFTYIVVLIILFNKRIKIVIKRYIFVLIVFLLGIMLLLVVGSTGAGMIVIFAAFGLAACILSRKQNTVFVLFVLLVFIITSILLKLGYLDSLAISDYGKSWYIVAITTQATGTLFVVAINSLFVDISRQKRDAEDNAKTILENARIYRLLFESSGVLVGYYSPQGVIMSYNNKAAEYLGGKPEDFIGKKITDVLSNTIADIYLKRITEALACDTTIEYEDFIPFVIGERWMFSTFNKITKLNGEISGVQIVSIDITDRKKAEEKLVYAAVHDGFTGVYNRKYFEDQKVRIGSTKRQSYAIVIMDINGVRIINDAFGFVEGDRLILETAKIIQACCFNNDILARTGGDEFSVLLHGNEKQVKKFIQCVKNRCNEYNEALLSKETEISLSYGYGVTNKEKSIEIAQKEAFDSLNKNKMLDSRSYQNSIITSIMATMYERSHETKDHAERIATYCKKIGEKIELSQYDLDQLDLFSKLHDIGKIGIDDSILNKPGKLSSEEWIEMKKHPEIGYRIAMSTPELKSCADLILAHHERWDGKGYPQGLSGEEIPLLSRILAIADAYDAMMEDRVYRKSMTKSEAISEIQRNVGTQFDPKLAKIFLELV